MTKFPLIEPSVADAMQAIMAAASLRSSTKTHMLCSLRQICRALDKPQETVPARWSAIKTAVHLLHPSRVGSNAKTLANHKSNARAALLWFADEMDTPKIGVPLATEWATLRGQISELHHRKRLSGLMRYCSAKAIGPEAVDRFWTSTCNTALTRRRWQRLRPPSARLLGPGTPVSTISRIGPAFG